MKTFEWAIEDIITAYPSLYLDHCAIMAVALLKRIASPCEFLVRVEGFDIAELNGETEFALRITWSSETEAESTRVERTEQRTPVVERAAVALAMLLFAHLVEDQEMCAAPQGHRADFLLPELHCALEVSGTEHQREVVARCQEKQRQVLANPYQWNGYVVVCCFEPTNPLIQWEYHSRKEQADG